MCGRFTLTLLIAEIQMTFNVSNLGDSWRPRYNIAPGQNVWVSRDPSSKQLEVMRWGLVPAWAKDDRMKNGLINARCETLLQKPTFRRPFLHQRCLILADGFFEWQRIGENKKGAIPYYFQRRDCSLFAFAGLWDERNSERTCAIITCPANACVAPVHERMPVILSEGDMWDWLQNHAPNDLLAALKPYPADDMIANKVSTRVNRPEFDQSDVIISVE